MDAHQAFVAFVNHAILKDRRDRYLTLASTPKGRSRILDDFWHNLESALDPDCRRASAFDESTWQKTAYLFDAGSGMFGEFCSSMRAAKNQSDTFGGWLIVSTDGRHAIFMPEEVIDETIYFAFR